ncbi:hypothetical protein KP509_10G012000 [Ceratopteris richardii]|nr:hypothetical protein KP509_10G012000 [Ceratopteris richardii]
MPWLETLRDTLIGYLVSVKAVVLACSALKPSYRQILRVGDLERNFITGKEHEKCEVGCLPNGEIKQHGHYEEQCKERHPTKGPELHPSSCGVKFLLLSGPMDLFASRLKERSKEGSHFMPPSLLQSQFDTLKIGDDEDDIVYLDARLSPEAIVQQAKESLA